MSRVEKRVTITCSVERLFAYVPEETHLIEMWPGLLEVGEVQRLPLGGVLARWIYKMTGLIYEDLDSPCEPLVDRTRRMTPSDDITCEMIWSFHRNLRAPQFRLDGDHTYWSLC